jgi:hypothetical protein
MLPFVEVSVIAAMSQCVRLALTALARPAIVVARLE